MVTWWRECDGGNPAVWDQTLSSEMTTPPPLNLGLEKTGNNQAFRQYNIIEKKHFCSKEITYTNADVQVLLRFSGSEVKHPHVVVSGAWRGGWGQYGSSLSTSLIKTSRSYTSATSDTSADKDRCRTMPPTFIFPFQLLGHFLFFPF